jgi:hypothetical protein
MTRCHRFHTGILSSAPRLLAAAALIAMLALGTGCDTVPLANQGAPAGLGVPGAEFLAEDGRGAAADTVVRDIEEADIVKIVGDKLYALNRYKGLLIVDVADPDNPTLVGELDLRGRGVEMYVVGRQVFAILTADFYFPYMGGVVGDAIPFFDSEAPPPDFDGSQLAVIDITDPTAPVLESKLNLAGFAHDSRRVGNIIYVVGGNIFPRDYNLLRENDGGLDEGFVASVDVSNPDDIVPVERKTFAGEALAVHVSDTSLFAASWEYDYENARTWTHVQLVDISDPAGTIAMRGTIDVPGYVDDRFCMDDFEGVFRIVTGTGGFGFAQVRVYTYDLSNPDNLTPLGEADIIQEESLRAVRFDGPKAYVVTFFEVDPLFVLDLRDPANPAVTGELEVPGFSTYIEPRGDRLIAVGVDDTDGRRPAVSYYDVSDPAAPAQLGRVILGPPGSFTGSEAVYDEKAFKVVDELGLIAVPFRHVEWPELPLADDTNASGYSPGDIITPECTNAVQLVDFSDAELVQRGFFEHRGRVERVGVIGDRVFALSQVGLQTVDITDRDEPARAGFAAFFEEGEMPFSADGCEGYVEPFVIPGDFAWLNSGLCGAFGALPAAILSVGLGITCLHGTRRRRQRGR